MKFGEGRLRTREELNWSFVVIRIIFGVPVGRKCRPGATAAWLRVAQGHCACLLLYRWSIPADFCGVAGVCAVPSAFLLRMHVRECCEFQCKRVRHIAPSVTCVYVRVYVPNRLKYRTIVLATGRRTARLYRPLHCRRPVRPAESVPFALLVCASCLTRCK